MNWPSTFDPFLKDVIQASAWLVAIVGGLLAAFKGLRELAESRRVRIEELRWKKAQLARDVLAGFFNNPRFRDAVTMLDWTGREYEIAPGRTAIVLWGDLTQALRAQGHGVSFDTKEVHIRDSFDALFDAMELLEHYLRTGLLEFEDVNFPMAYHVARLREHSSATEPFMRRYGYDLALAFVNRFPEEATLANKPLQPTTGAGALG
jgi:hypothetical protein